MPFTNKNLNYPKSKNDFLYGYLIRKAREECEISLLFLSEISGISSSVISRAEHGLISLNDIQKKNIEKILEINIEFSNEINQMLLTECNNLVLAWANEDIINFTKIYKKIKQQSIYVYSSAFPIYTLALLFYEVTTEYDDSFSISNKIKELNLLIDLLDNQQKTFLSILTLIFIQQSSKKTQYENYFSSSYITENELSTDLSSGVIYYYLSKYFSNLGNATIAEKYGKYAINNFIQNMYTQRISKVKISLALAYMLSNRFEEARNTYLKLLVYFHNNKIFEHDSIIYNNLLICSIFDNNSEECLKWCNLCDSLNLQNKINTKFYMAIILFLRKSENLLNFLDFEIDINTCNDHEILLIDLIKFSIKNKKQLFEETVNKGISLYKDTHFLLNKKLFLEIGIEAGYRIENYKIVSLLQENYISTLKKQLQF